MYACSHFEEMPGHPRTCWACGGPKGDHTEPPAVPPADEDPCPICGGDGDRISREDCPQWQAMRAAVSQDFATFPGSVVVSPDFEAYASGQLGAEAVRCVGCGKAPCQCPEFGTPEYMAQIDRIHGRRR